jgi:hypothetical protein
MELLIKQKEENDNQEPEESDDPDKRHEDKKKQANELRKQIDEAVEEIRGALKQEPQISDSDLESDNREWLSLIGYALSKKQVDDIKSKVLADISAKRGIKQGKRKREDEENENTNDNPNKKLKVGNEEKNG